MIGRRVGRPGLIGTMARTAVVAGTASATANAVSRRQAQRYERQADAQAYEQQQQQQQYAAQQAAAQQAAVQPPAPAADAGDALGDQLTKIAQLHQQGILNDEEFAAAKQRLLG
jgi:hypothetical protein